MQDTTRYKKNTELTVREILHVANITKKKTVRKILHVTNTTQNIQCVKYYTYQIEQRTYSVRDNTRNK